MSAVVHELGARRARGRSSQDEVAAAFLLPGVDAGAWLDEIARWGIATSRLELAVLPAGALVILPRRGSIAVRPRGIPYRRLGATLMVPMDAELDAGLSTGELDELLAPHALVVFHPAIGMVGFAGEDLLPVDRLLTPPPSLPRARWDAANPGPRARPRLASVRLEPAPPVTSSLENVFAAEREEIASASADERAAAAAAGASPSFGQRLREAIESMRSGGTGGRSGKEGSRRAHDPALERRRREEIERLLRMLADDPERGLRFALPVASAFGDTLPDAPPSPTLPEREPIFSLGRRGAARAVDTWRATRAQHDALIAHYQRLAAREIALGRHRRAAYIQAELLGDVGLAASTLRDGECWRDAATLYLDHLDRPLMAAVCLRDGGYLEEAADLYLRAGEAERAGELYARLGDEARAESAFRRAVEKRLGEGDRVGAAGLLETRIGAVDEALATLASGWPHSSQSRDCLRELVTTLGRHGRHREATGLAARLAAIPERPVHAARALSGACASYPELRVRAALGDAVRVIAGRALSAHTSADPEHGGLAFGALEPSERAECESLLEAVRDLEQGDRLLARDVDRARMEIGRAAARPVQRAATVAPAAARQDRRQIAVVRTFMLPRDADWLALATMGESLVAAGRTELGPVLVRCDSSGRFQRMDWRRPNLQPAHFELVPHPGSDRITLVPRPSHALQAQILPATSRFDARIEVETPAWLPEGVLGITAGQGRTLWTLWRNPEGILVLDCRALDGRVLTTELLPGVVTGTALDPGPGERGAPMLFAAPALWFAAGARLHVLGLRGELDSCALSEPARQIVLVDVDAVRTRVVVVGAHSISLVARSRDRISILQTVARGDLDLEDPVAAVSSRGALMVFSRVGGHAWRVEGDRLASVSGLDPVPSPSAAVALSVPDEVALMQTTGEVRVLAVRPRQ